MRLSVLVSLLLLLSACAHQGGAVHSNLSDLIQGTWAEYVQDGEIKVYVTYLPDGRFHTFGYFPPEFDTYFFADGYWQIEGDKSCIYITYISTDESSPGDAFCNRIVRLDDKEFVFDSRGEDIKMLRISDSDL